MSQSNTAAIKASIIDGIAITPRYRERALAALHRGLECAREELIEAAEKQNLTHNEAKLRTLLILDAVRHFHSLVHPQKCHEVEYRVARSQDHPDQRQPFGYVYIGGANGRDPYSLIVAVAAALAAGNCVLVQQPTQPTSADTMLNQLMVNALSSESFLLVKEDPFETDFQQKYGASMEINATEPPVCSTRVVRISSGNSVAIVDRTADLKAAARDCVHARFAFGGKAAYAPDLVLVNDFCVSSFTSAVAEAALEYLTKTAGSKGSSGPTDSSAALNDDLTKFGSVVVSGHKGRVVLVEKRTDDLLKLKVSSPTLLIVPITSVDDALDFLNSSNGGRLAAAYIYSTANFAKYIGQFLRTSISLINHLPPELLVGQLGPEGDKVSVHPRYTPELFSIPSPAYIQVDSKIELLRDATWPRASLKQGKGQRLNDLIDARLVPVKEPFGPVVGFFEQGFLFGASLVLSTTAVCCALTIKYGYPALMARLR